MGVPGGRHHASPIHVAIPSVLQAASYGAREKSALWQSGCTKSSILGARTHFPYCAAGPCIAAASLQRSV